MANLIVCILTNLFRVYLIYRYIKIFAEEPLPDYNCRKTVRGLAFLVFFLINTGSYLAFHSAWINLITNLAGIFLLTLMYYKSFKNCLFVAGSVYLINMICDTVATLPFVEYIDGQDTNQFFAVIMVFLFFICELFTKKIIIYRMNKYTAKNLPLAMMLVPISSIITFGMLMYTSSNSQTVLLIVSIGFLFINFLILYLYNILIKSFTRHYENELLRQRAQIYANQLNLIFQNEEKLKLLKHDMKHHLTELKLLAMKQNSSAILTYLKDMDDFMQNPNEFVSSGNLEIDSILNYMLQQAKKSLLSVNVKIQIPENISHSFDINIVLGNLLENAIEAAEKTEEKILNALITLKQGILKIEIENSFCGTQISQNSLEKGLIFSTKKDQEHHGFGLKSVKRIVEKYHGAMEIYPDGKLFCVKVILYLS